MVVAQKFETEIYVSPLINLKNSNQNSDSVEDPKNSLCLSFGINEFYKISERLSIGVGLDYNNLPYKFTNYYIGVLPGIWDAHIESRLNMQTLNLPLILKVEIIPNYFLKAASGLTYVLKSKGEAYYNSKIWSMEEFNSDRFFEENSVLDENRNSFIEIDFSREFPIGKSVLCTALFYHASLNNYHFTHPNLGMDYFITNKVKPQQVGIKLGLKL